MTLSEKRNYLTDCSLLNNVFVDSLHSEGWRRGFAAKCNNWLEAKSHGVSRVDLLLIDASG